MASEQLIERITTDPKVMGGKPVIKGTRVTVETIVKLVASGASNKEIIEDFPHIAEEDIRAALLYAAKILESEDIFPVEPGESK